MYSLAYPLLRATMARTLPFAALLCTPLLHAATTPSTAPSPGDWEAMWQWDLAQAHQLRTTIEQASGTHTLDNTLVPLDRTLMHLFNVFNTTNAVNLAHPDPALRELASQRQQEAQQTLDNLWLSRPLYEAVLMVDPTTFASDPLATHWRARALESYQRNGVDKEEATRQTIANLRADITALEQTFEQQIKDDVRSITLHSSDQLAGLPPDYQARHQPDEQGKITITTRRPDYFPFMGNAHDATLRQALYAAFKNRAYPANKAILQEMLQKRQTLAHLLGYEDYASYILVDNMAGTKEVVRTFIDELQATVAPPAKEIYDAILAHRRTFEPEADTLAPWDTTYWSRKYKETHFGVDPDEVRQYFPSSHVKATLLELTSAFFGITYQPVAEDPRAWHPDVVVYDIYRQGDDSKPLGRVYLDFYPRQGKYQHACCCPMAPGVVGPHGQSPYNALLVNLPQPSADDPNPLLEFEQVKTLFHEIGHILHDIVSGQGSWARFAGTYNIAIDYVEVPSMFIERWLATPSILRRVTQHHQTGEPMPDDLMHKVIQAREWTKALDMQRMLVVADMSLTYHTADPTAPAFDLDAIREACWTRPGASLTSYPYGTHMWANFIHLRMYTACYYSYTWAEAIGEDIYQAMKKQGLDNPTAYQHYIQSLLVPGGGDEPSNLVTQFLSRPFTTQAYQRRLTASQAHT